MVSGYLYSTLNWETCCFASRARAYCVLPCAELGNLAAGVRLALEGVRGPDLHCSAVGDPPPPPPQVITA
jgi:hypothetical protein